MLQEGFGRIIKRIQIYYLQEFPCFSLLTKMKKKKCEQAKRKKKAKKKRKKYDRGSIVFSCDK